MNKDHLYAFYGSLRKGMSNHSRYQQGLEYLFTDSLLGFVLYVLPGYPYAVKSHNPRDVITVEIHRVIDTATEQAIHNLEIGVGYRYEEVTVGGVVAGIYVFEKAGTEPLVAGGDWVKFFGSR